MAEVSLLVLTTIAALEAVGLVGVEVGNRTYLEPAVLSLAIHLKVVAQSGSEAHVAAAEAQNAIRKLQLLEQALHVGKHLAVRLIAMLGSVDAHNLNLRELVQTVESAHVLSVAAGFAAEALSVGTVLDRQLFLVENHVAVDISHRHLGSRDKIEIVEVAVIHLPLLVGELAGAISRSLIHHCGRHNLGVAGSSSLVEEELD